MLCPTSGSDCSCSRGCCCCYGDASIYGESQLPWPKGDFYRQGWICLFLKHKNFKPSVNSVGPLFRVGWLNDGSDCLKHETLAKLTSFPCIDQWLSLVQDTTTPPPPTHPSLCPLFAYPNPFRPTSSPRKSQNLHQALCWSKDCTHRQLCTCYSPYPWRPL